MSKAAALELSLTKAGGFLDKVLSSPASDIQRAAAIQAFEFTFELSWKLLQARLRDEGVDAATPRTVFRTAGDAGLIAEVEPWLGYLDARNLTSHTYNEETAQQVYAVISGAFSSDVHRLLSHGRS